MKKLRPTRIRDFIMYFTYLEKIAIIYVASAVADFEHPPERSSE